jgi:hypothetical protein
MKPYSLRSFIVRHKIIMNATDLLWLLLPLAAASATRGAVRTETSCPAIVRSAIGLFQGPQFPSERTTGQGDRSFMRVLEVNLYRRDTSGAGKSFSPPGRSRARHPHPSEPDCSTHTRQGTTQSRIAGAGPDYLKAGLFDRAENLFLELAEIRAHSEQALKLLLHIYQQEKNGKRRFPSPASWRVSGKNLMR